MNAPFQTSEASSDAIAARPPLNLLIAAPRGFCAGVDREIEIVEKALERYGAPVFVRVACEGLGGVIEVLDSGTGMSPEFIRTRLFKPFDSTKSGGFGIGAYEARELIRAMRGRLDVESCEGLGSRFTIHLPLYDAAELIDTLAAKRVA